MCLNVWLPAVSFPVSVLARALLADSQGQAPCFTRLARSKMSGPTSRRPTGKLGSSYRMPHYIMFCFCFFFSWLGQVVYIYPPFMLVLIPLFDFFFFGIFSSGRCYIVQ